MMPSPQFIATRVITCVLNGISLREALDKPFVKQSSDKSFIQAMCYGVCRNYPRLTALLSLLLRKPIKNKDNDIQALAMIGLHQLSHMHVKEYAAVTETVEVAVYLKKIWAKNLINAVLRNFLRKREFLEAELLKQEPSCFAHPAWIIETVKKDWPNHWESILNANNQQPPFACRINTRLITKEDYLHQLATNGLSATIISETTSGIIFDAPLLVEEVPLFFEGNISVQDGGAQFAATLLDLKPDQRVLDACAAPGGKLTHILELGPNLKNVTAIEKEKTRMHLIQENLQRLHFKANCILADAGSLADWWDGEWFNRILLDAPCSASGVIRRHPDIKLLRHKEDILRLQQEQLRLLNELWRVLAPNGMLLYCTCSIFRAENEDVMQHFFDTHTDAIHDIIDAPWGIPLSIGRQILPGMHHMDGFYYAKIKKSAKPL